MNRKNQNHYFTKNHSHWIEKEKKTQINEMKRNDAYILTYSIHTFILFKTLLMYFMSASYKTTWLINFVTFSLPIT